MRDSRLNLDWIARSIRTEPVGAGMEMSPAMLKRYGLVTSPRSEPGNPRYDVSPEVLKRVGLKSGKGGTSPSTNVEPPPTLAPSKPKLTEAEILALPIADPAGEA